MKRPRLTAIDRLFWAWQCEVWSGWRSALVSVKPEIVIAWRRKGFRLRKMSRENRLRGAPRIHDELLKVGIEAGETSVSKYLVRSRKQPSKTWRTFLENHVKTHCCPD